MRVLLVMDQLSGGGTERQMQMLVRNWPSDHPPPVVCVLREPPHSAALPAEIKALGRGGGDVLLPFRLAWVAKQHRCDLVLGSHRFSGLLAKLARVVRPSLRVVCSIRGRHRYSSKEALLYDHLDLTMMRLARRIIVNSRAVERDLAAKRHLRARIRYVPNGLETRTAAAGVARERFGIALATPLIVAVGRLAEIKDPLFAVEVLHRVHLAGVEAHLVWVGDGPLAEAVHERARELRVGDHLHLTGNLEDPTPYLVDADVGLHTSRWENTSNALIEEMAQGLPTVARDVGGNRDLIDHDRNGLLLPAGASAKQWAEMMVKLLNDPVRRASLAEGARRTVRENYSVEKRVQGHSKVLNEATS